MDFLFTKELTSVGFICNIWVANKMASKSLILCSKVNKVDFKCSEGFLEKL